MYRMSRTASAGLLLMTTGLILLASCGGDTSITPQDTPHADQPTSAILTLSTAVTGTIAADTTINSYIVNVTLPAGVTVQTQQSSSATAPGVVVASGGAAGSLIEGVYTSSTVSTPGMLKIYVVSAAGIVPGEFCIVNGDITPGSFPTAGDIVQPTLEDATGFNDHSTVLDLENELAATLSAVFQ